METLNIPVASYLINDYEEAAKAIGVSKDALVAFIFTCEVVHTRNIKAVNGRKSFFRDGVVHTRASNVRKTKGGVR